MLLLPMRLCHSPTYYNQNAGRFYTPDPSTGVDPKNPVTWNKYAYGSDDPVNRIDPRGLEDCSPEEDDCRDNGSPSFPIAGGPEGGNGPSRQTPLSLFAIDVVALKGDARNFATALLSGNLPTPCATDIASLGITPDQWASALNNVSIQYGPGNLYPLASILQVGSAEWQVARSRGLVVRPVQAG